MYTYSLTLKHSSAKRAKQNASKEKTNMEKLAFF